MKKAREIVPQFQIFFSRESTHYVTLFVHPTIRQLRALGKYKNENTVDDAHAFCWYQGNGKISHRDGFVAEIHMARDNVKVDYIAHEATHAAYQRNRFMCRAPLIEEEEFATDVGILTDAIVAHLTVIGVKIKSGK